MTELLLRLCEVLAPVIVAAGIGFVWARRKQPFDHAMVTGLVSWVGAPMLVFHTLATVQIEPAAVAGIGFAAVMALVIFAGLALVALRIAALPIRDYLPTLMFPNIGNMGLPVCYFAYGEQGLAFAIVVFAVISTAFFTLGVWIASRASHWSDMLRSPLLWAVAAGLSCNLNSVELPRWLENTTELLAQFAIPLMLITLGVSLASMKVADLSRALPMGVARVWGGAAVGVLVASVLGLEGAARGVVVLQCSMPAAVFAYLMAQKYERSPQQVAGVVLVSTAASFATLPFLVSWLLGPLVH